MRLYRGLLALYPTAYREQFGEEMIAVLSEMQVEFAAKNSWQRTAWWMRETAGLLCGVLREHARALGASDWLAFSTLASSTRRFTMHNGFRFPRTTAVLMTIILAGVIVAIRKGEAIEASLPHVSQPIAPIHSAPSYLLPGVVAGFLFFYAAGLIGWAILFALHRSGVHRLDEMSMEK
jgi:hypothetical protein